MTNWPTFRSDKLSKQDLQDCEQVWGEKVENGKWGVLVTLDCEIRWRDLSEEVRYKVGKVVMFARAEEIFRWSSTGDWSVRSSRWGICRGKQTPSAADIQMPRCVAINWYYSMINDPAILPAVAKLVTCKWLGFTQTWVEFANQATDHRDADRIRHNLGSPVWI